MRSYDYCNRDGVDPITWERFAELSRGLTESLEACNLDLVVAVARGGLFPATAVAGTLRCEFFPVRLSRRTTVAWQKKITPLLRDDLVERLFRNSIEPLLTGAVFHFLEEFFESADEHLAVIKALMTRTADVLIQFIQAAESRVTEYCVSEGFLREVRNADGEWGVRPNTR